MSRCKLSGQTIADKISRLKKFECSLMYRGNILRHPHNFRQRIHGSRICARNRRNIFSSQLFNKSPAFRHSALISIHYHIAKAVSVTIDRDTCLSERCYGNRRNLRPFDSFSADTARNDILCGAKNRIGVHITGSGRRRILRIRSRQLTSGFGKCDALYSGAPGVKTQKNHNRSPFLF